MVNMSAKFEKRNTQRIIRYHVHKLISIYVHCDLWPLTCKINRAHHLIMVNMSANFDKEICNGLVVVVFYVHCDLDLWPLTSKINRVHPLIMVNMSTKFDKEICNSLGVITFTRSTLTATCCPEIIIRVVRRQLRSPGGNHHWIEAMVNVFQTRSNFKVKVKRSKIMVPCKRSCHKEYTCAIWKPYHLW